MENKYTTFIFENGRVAFVKNEDIEKTFSKNKQILLICNCENGGDSIVIKPVETTQKDKNYITTIKPPKEITLDNTSFSRFYKVIITEGQKIYMQTGNPANRYKNGTFYDTTGFERPVGDLWDYITNCTTVNSKLTVKNIVGYRKEMVKTLISRHIIQKDSEKFL